MGHLVKKVGVSDELIQTIHATDQQMYQCPLTHESLKSWIQRAPDFSVAYHDDVELPPSLAGVIVTLPIIAAHWQDLLIGKLKEWEISPSMIAKDEMTEARIGVHVFHIEKYEAWKRCAPGHAENSFIQIALKDVASTTQRTKWDVIGWSALVASADGSRSFEKNGFKKTGYEEVFLSSRDSQGSIEMKFVLPGQEQAGPLNVDHERIVSRSAMMVNHVQPGRSSSI